MAAACLAAPLLGVSRAHAAADPAAAALAEFVKPFLILPADSAGAWDDLEKVRAVRWGAGPVDSDHPSPDGNYFARPGQAAVGGHPIKIVATGARSMVFSLYLRDPTPPMDPEALAAGLREAGFAVAPARCPINPASSARKRWYRITLPRKKAAFLAAGPLQSGGSGYTVYLGDLPAMTQAEAALYTDRCGGSGPQRP